MERLIIGASGGHRYRAPGHLVGNRPKRVDTALLTLVEESANDKLTPGGRSLGLKENGLSIGPLNVNLVTSDL
ncbi:MAG: hypothetical protein JXA42_11560 [Anaerolineales bacterium]|nr:hypothetical protein [Anaerolineales bacterium]